MSIYSFQIPTNNHQFSIVRFDKGLSDEQCDLILEQSKDLEVTQGGIVRSEVQHETNDNIRNVTVKTVSIEDMDWLYDTMYEYIHEANSNFFGFDVYGLHESMQLLHYGEDIGGGHYDWHMDCGPGIADRKITVIVQLSNEEDYQGCDTEVFNQGTLEKTRGSVFAFPSYMTHRVTPLTKGSRDALVMWVNGPTYR